MRADIEQNDNIPELTEFFQPAQQKLTSKATQSSDEIPELSEEAAISIVQQPNVDTLVAEALEKIMPSIKAEVKKAVLQRLTSLEKELCTELEAVLKEKVAMQLKDSLTTQPDKT